MASFHGAINRDKSVVFDHDEPPDGDGQSQPNRHIVNDNAEVGVEPQIGCPAPGILLRGLF